MWFSAGRLVLPLFRMYWQGERMITLFAPLRRRPIWIAFGIVLVLGAVVVSVEASSGATPTKLTSEALLSVGVAFFVAAVVAFLKNQEPDYRAAVMQGVDRPRRRQIRRAVMRGNLDLLAEEDRVMGRDFAQAYLASTPRALCPSIVLLVGFLFQAAAQVAEFDGGWFGYLILIEAVLILGMLIIAIPLNVRWLRNAERLATQTVRQ